MNIGELITTLGVDSSQLERADKKVYSFGQNYSRAFDNANKKAITNNDIIRQITAQVGAWEKAMKDVTDPAEIDRYNKKLSEAKFELEKLQHTGVEGNDKMGGSWDELLGKVVTYAAGIFTVSSALSSLVTWYKNTEEGADDFNKVLHNQKQIMYDLFHAPGRAPKDVPALGGRFSSAVDANREQKLLNELIARENELRKKERADLVEAARLEREIRINREAAYDDDVSIEERLNSQTKAYEDQKKLEAFLKENLQERLDLVQGFLKLRENDTGLLNEQAKLQAAMYDQDSKQSIRMLSYLNTLKNQKDGLLKISEKELEILRKKELLELKMGDEFVRRNMQIYNKKNPTIVGLGPLEDSIKEMEALSELPYEKLGKMGLIDTRDQVEQLTNGLLDQRDAVGILSDSFMGFFESAEEGWKHMLDTWSDAINRFLAEQAAKALLKFILTLIPGGSPAAAALNFLPTGGGGSASDLLAPISGVAKNNIDISGNLKVDGKDLTYAVRRNA